MLGEHVLTHIMPLTTRHQAVCQLYPLIPGLCSAMPTLVGGAERSETLPHAYALCHAVLGKGPHPGPPLTLCVEGLPGRQPKTGGLCHWPCESEYRRPPTEEGSGNSTLLTQGAPSFPPKHAIPANLPMNKYTDKLTGK